MKKVISIAQDRIRNGGHRMQPTLKGHTCRTIGAVGALTAGLIAASPVAPVAAASDTMPAAQQNALVQKYCVVCHDDLHQNGGLSLQHFDAADPDPSVAAMMVSKLVSGVSLETLKAAASDASAAALLAKGMKSSAIGAAGIPTPDRQTVEALIGALAAKTVGANEWHVNRTQDSWTKAPLTVASIVRELPRDTGTAETYRLVLSCNATTHEGEMALAWAPSAKKGTLTATVDGKAQLTYMIEATGRMGNGAPGYPGGAFVKLDRSTLGESKRDFQNSRMVLPAHTLTIGDLLPNESVVFPFDGLPQTARQAFSTCFSGTTTTQ